MTQHTPYFSRGQNGLITWHNWSQKTLELAEKEDKPILLCIGGFSCQQSRTVDRTFFEHNLIGELLEDHFIPIRVDREFWPDLSELYTRASMVIAGDSGWPNVVLLTPDGRPFYVITSFLQGKHTISEVGELLSSLVNVWKTRRTEVEQNGHRFSQEMMAIDQIKTIQPISSDGIDDCIDKALTTLYATFDPFFGGFGGAPKFPSFAGLRLLINQLKEEILVDQKPDPAVLNMLTVTLDGMAAGGLRDHLGGGFHRYTIDSSWKTPHFQKTLVDNAQMANIYTETYNITKNEAYKEIALHLFGWVSRTLTSAEGAFYTSTSDETPGQNSTYYLWTTEEILSILGPKQGSYFCDLYGVEKEGNWSPRKGLGQSGHNILFRPTLNTPPKNSSVLDLDCGAQLLAIREQRESPAVDDTIITVYNALMIESYARAGVDLDRPELVRSAIKAASFVLSELYKDKNTGELKRCFYKGAASGIACLSDYAALASALLTLFEATNESKWLKQTWGLIEQIFELFIWPTGDFFHYKAHTEGHNPLFSGLTTLFDASIPNGLSLFLGTLARLNRLDGEKKISQTQLKLCEDILSKHFGLLNAYPHATLELTAAYKTWFSSAATL